VPVGSCADPCPKFGVRNSSCEHSQHAAAPQQTQQRISHPKTAIARESRPRRDCSKAISDQLSRRPNLQLHLSTMAEMQMESEEVLMARFEELSVLETEFEDVEIEISE
jgi:hypothetical protein